MQKAQLHLNHLSQTYTTWLLEHGEIWEVTAGTTLIRDGELVEQIYVVLEGDLAAAVIGAEGKRQEVYHLLAGEIAGIVSFLDRRPALAITWAVAPSLVLRLSCQQLTNQLKQDQTFAAQFYQAIAAILSKRLRSISTLLVRSQATIPSPQRKILFLFSELTNKDISWIATTGEQQHLPANTILIQEGQAVDALYVLLQGTLAVTITVMVGGTWVSKEIAQLGAGEIVGEMSFLDTQTPSATICTLESCQVLRLPRPCLTHRLQQDTSFAVRFSRAAAMLIVDRLRNRLVHHGYSMAASYGEQPALQEWTEPTVPMEQALFDKLTVAKTRFSFFIQSLNLNH